MPVDLDFLDPADKPALVAIASPELLSNARLALAELDYKPHTARESEDFHARFGRIPYQVTILEDPLSWAAPGENGVLQRLQTMSMALRRHTAIFLIGGRFTTLDPMQAFQQSVHAVVNSEDWPNLKQIIRQVVADNIIFLSVYRDAIHRMTLGKP